MSLGDWSCPLPKVDLPTITMSHGAGGGLSAKLFDEVFSKHYPSKELLDRNDSAVIDWDSRYRLAISTDAFVVEPRKFPGGDIGSLSVYGTINDLAVQGAEPIALTIAWVLEEGFPLSELHELASSVGKAAADCSVRVLAGDTKVVQRGRGHGCYITTTGLGRVPKGLELGSSRICLGDCILLSGPIGEHGMAIMSQRSGLDFDPVLKSDCAPLHRMAMSLASQVSGLKLMRDPTRGGISAVLNEFAASSQKCFEIQEASVPIRSQVKSACELLGIDPWVVANEGKLLAIVSCDGVQAALDIMRKHPEGSQACQIGQVTGRYPRSVIAETLYGTKRIVAMPSGELLPRIC